MGLQFLVTALAECCNDYGGVQRSAMLKASGCLDSTSTEEILTNTPPTDLLLKLRQAQEVVRISAKHNDDPLKADFDEGDRTVGRKPCILHQLMSNVEK